MWSQVCSLELVKNCNQRKIVVFLLSIARQKHNWLWWRNQRLKKSKLSVFKIHNSLLTGDEPTVFIKPSEFIGQNLRVQEADAQHLACFPFPTSRFLPYTPAAHTLMCKRGQSCRWACQTLTYQETLIEPIIWVRWLQYKDEVIDLSSCLPLG